MNPWSDSAVLILKVLLLLLLILLLLLLLLLLVLLLLRLLQLLLLLLWMALQYNHSKGLGKTVVGRSVEIVSVQNSM